MIDDVGCVFGCVVMDFQRKEMVVVRDEVIYFYSFDGCGVCLVYEGKFL